MDREVIEQKLESLRRCLQRIQEKCPPSSETLGRDVDLQDILALNLTRAIQLCVDIGAHLIAGKDTPPPATMGQTFDVLAELGCINTELAIRMKKTLGFRNIAVHNYEAINWQIVHAIATSHLTDFKEFAQAVIQKTGL
ncbi:hypothetical protein SCT_2461 [Sulfuricella sp. T08]|uniref:type VII toxin-antitoxin system HepT family RNase toxin n=1 Tax=Sulfuricella sp. T08 TaxID=1632857 RepID=UPI000617A101|nr:DUF86 domain-containing protein [Sulfuricella sp. T08]GAO37046.1 hypothetical protein SCT_2461 [Sulfuricella sp. T08]